MHSVALQLQYIVSLEIYLNNKVYNINMDEIEIINIEDEEIEEDEEDSEEEEEEIDYEEYEDSIKKKTDRELIENIALRMLSLEKNMKQIQDDLIDTYNILIEEKGIEDEE